MASRQTVKKSIFQLERVKTWQLLILLVLALVLTATFLRLNNIGMIERRTAVINADKKGDAELTQARLFDLQRYAAEHMNADSGPIYLEEQYKRDVKKATEASMVRGEATIQDRTKAYDTCAGQFSTYSQPWVQCVVAELEKYVDSSDNQQTLELPSSTLYRHEFASPLWSPDFAGFAALFSVLITVVIIVRIISLGILRIMLRKHYQPI